MKVSIITSCYNREATIRGAIESVLEQDYPYIEYIVVDGASKDNSLAVINEYKNGIDTIISEPDKGMYEAINKGIRAATGDIIGLIHSDDFLFSSHTISDIVKTFEEQDADMIYGNGVFVDYDDTNQMIRNWISGRYSKENVKNGWLPLHPTVYIKKECMDKWGLYDESYKIAADSDLLVRYLYEANLKVYYLNKYIVKMRMGGLSTDAGKSKLKWAEDLRMYKSHGIKPISALKGKILSKIPQFIEARLPWSEIPEAEEESLIQPAATNKKNENTFTSSNLADYRSSSAYTSTIYAGNYRYDEYSYRRQAEAGNSDVGRKLSAKQMMPARFDYNTGNYFVSISFFSFLELAYRETLIKGDYISSKPKYNQQDRSYSIRLCVWKEGKFLPGIALGANDPIADKGANTFQSYYGVITKKSI